LEPQSWLIGGRHLTEAPEHRGILGRNARECSRQRETLTSREERSVKALGGGGLWEFQSSQAAQECSEMGARQGKPFLMNLSLNFILWSTQESKSPTRARMPDQRGL
jgi:hypothetical protein